MKHLITATRLYTYEGGKALLEHGGRVKGIANECDCIGWVVVIDLLTRNMVVTVSYL